MLSAGCRPRLKNARAWAPYYHDVAHTRTSFVFFHRKTIELSLCRVMPTSFPCDKRYSYPTRRWCSCKNIISSKVRVALGKSLPEFVYFVVEICHPGPLPSATPGFSLWRKLCESAKHQRRRYGGPKGSITNRFTKTQNNLSKHKSIS